MFTTAFTSASMGQSSVFAEIEVDAGVRFEVLAGEEWVAPSR